MMKRKMMKTLNIKEFIPDKIKKLKELRDDDIISDEDFETKKQELLEKY